VLALIVGVVAFPVVVFAQPSASVQPITSAMLTNKVGLTVSVTGSCGPFVSQTGSLTVDISQAVGGHQIAQANSGQTIDCDGLPHTVTLTMTASSVPFP
jgi:hypothetical protein